MANDAKNDSLKRLRSQLASIRNDKRLAFAPMLRAPLVEALDALEAVVVEQARNQRTIANAICAIAAEIDPKHQRMFAHVLGDETARKIAEIFYAGEDL